MKPKVLRVPKGTANPPTGKTDDLYSQIVVWPGTVLETKAQEKAFKTWIKGQGFHEPKILGMLTTLPDRKDGQPVPGTGGRLDLLFRVHAADIPRFAVWRLQWQMSWWEDALSNWGLLYSDADRARYPRTW